MLESAVMSALGTLRRQWIWIAALATAGSLVAGGWALSRPRLYIASVDIVPRRTVLSVPPGGTIAVATSVGASFDRRRALAALVRNPDVERSVQQELSPVLPAELREPASLIGVVSVRAPAGTELLTISVGASEPELASRIAVEWSKAYVRKVNFLYGVADEERVGSMLSAARQSYESLSLTAAGRDASPGVGIQSAIGDVERDASRAVYAEALRKAEELRLARALGFGDEVVVANDAPLVQPVNANVRSWAVRGMGLGAVSAAVGVLALSASDTDRKRRALESTEASHTAPASHAIRDVK
jgi:uncharacterized protein involved in exopolysaccharide biosynthesis